MKNRMLSVSLAVALVLSVGLIGCGREEEPEILEYNLTISSTGGGSVTTPGEGTSAFDERTVVNLVAEAEQGYKFVNWSGDVSTVKDLNAAETTISMHGSYSITANFEREYMPMVTGGASHTVGLKADGTVVAVGSNASGQCNVAGWTDITQVAGTFLHTVGLRADGTVVAVGSNASGQCNVGGWTDIIQVAAGYDHTVGLRYNGTVVAVGGKWAGKCAVGGWTDIFQVAAGASHTVGLTYKGTTVATGSNTSWQCNVGGWRGIIQVAAGHHHTVGLRYDGAVVAVGSNVSGQCHVGDWMLV